MPFQAVLEFLACFWLQMQFYALHWTSIILKWSFWHRQIAKTAACCSFGKAFSCNSSLAPGSSPPALPSSHCHHHGHHGHHRHHVTMVTMSPWSPCHHVRQALLKASQSFAPLVFKNSGSTWSSRAQDLLKKIRYQWTCAKSLGSHADNLLPSATNPHAFRRLNSVTVRHDMNWTFFEHDSSYICVTYIFNINILYVFNIIF